MADIEIQVDGGASKRLLTAGKYCDKNILVIATGGGEPPVSVNRKEVNFYDYEGTLLYAYTLDEAKALSELPPAPQREGLLFQKWNWTLEDIKALTKPMSIGATYITDDGKTRLYITVPVSSMSDRPAPRNQVPLYIQQTIANGVTIDWGDGTEPETLPGTGTVNTTHTYDQGGNYVISLEPVEGCELGLGASSGSYCVLGSIGNNGRVYCNMLQKVYIGNNVTSIGNYAFRYCCSLASITIPDSVTSIGGNAFQYCYSLASITIPDSVTSIGDYAFYACYALASITIPDNVTSIGNCAFRYCSALVSITIPDSVTSIDDYAFYACYSLASITIPDSVTSIGGYAFYTCYSLASITIPDSVTSIGDYVFYTCYSLASITIPDSVTSIGDYAFQACYALASITIPDNVTSIGNYAFRYCYGMKEYHFLSPTPPTLRGADAFSGISSDCIVYVPVGSVEAYKTATNWTTIADHIQEGPWPRASGSL